MTGRLDAQARADRIRAFQAELAQLDTELGGVLDPAQQARIAAHQEAVLAELARQYDVATTTTDRQLALGLRLASFLGALAFCIAVVLFVERFWGALATATQVGLLTAGTLALLALTEFAARRERTLYFAGLAALVAFGLFVTDVSILGQVYNLVPSVHGFLLWALFAGALTAAYRLRLLLVAMLVTGAVWMAGAIAQLGGLLWTESFSHPECYLLPALAAAAVGVWSRRAREQGLAHTWRLTGLILFFYSVILLASFGQLSALPGPPGRAEALYQVVGFLAAGLAIWDGIRRGWNDVTNTGVAAFTILTYVKAVDWWWDWMPRWLFFLVLGAIAVAVMLLLKRLKERQGVAA
jgi:uncharacterized membrane protein